MEEAAGKMYAQTENAIRVELLKIPKVCVNPLTPRPMMSTMGVHSLFCVFDCTCVT